MVYKYISGVILALSVSVAVFWCLMRSRGIDIWAVTSGVHYTFIAGILLGVKHFTADHVSLYNNYNCMQNISIYFIH